MAAAGNPVAVFFMKNRKILKYHSLAGLIVGIFLFLMGISGSILVFQHDLEDLQWEKYKEVVTAEDLNIDLGIKSIQEKYPKWDTRLIHFKQNEALIFNLRKPSERLFIFVHPSTGEIIEEINEFKTFTRWLLKFHYSFHAGTPGKILVLVIGVLFLFSLLTGLYLYRKSFFKTLFFQTRIIHKNKRTFYSSLHRIIGVWSIFLNLLLVVTGIFLAWTVVAAGLKQPSQPETPIITTSTQGILDHIRVQNPNFTPTYVRLPLTAGADLRVYGNFDDDAFFYSQFYNSFLANPVSGKITDIIRVQQADLKTKLSSTLIPLHFGQYGGFWSKVLYCLVGLSGPFLSISGFIIWKKRNQMKNFK